MTGIRRKWLVIGYLAVALAGGAACRTIAPRLEALAAATDTSGAPFSGSVLSAMALFALIFALTVFLSAPTNPLFCLAAGYLFGAVRGTAVAALAITLGSMAAYCFFRMTVTPPLRTPGLRNPFLTIALLRASPWFPAPLVNLFCGICRVRPLLFAASTMAGTIPLAGVYALAASRMRGPLDASLLRSPEIVTALAVLGAVSLVGFLRPLRIVAEQLRGVTAPAARAADHRT